MFVNLITPVNPLGYGVVGFNVLSALMNKGHNVSLFALGDVQWESNPDAIEKIKKAANNGQFFDPDAPSIRIWHQHDMAMFPGRGPRIGWPIFELDEFTDKEYHHLSSVDRLIVCSNWAKKVIEKAGIEKQVDVVPLGIDPSVFFVDEHARKNRPWWNAESTVFVNAGKWEVRKGHNELIEAFCKAFTPDDNVELRMLNENPFIGLENENWKIKYINSPMGGKITILPRVDSQAELRNLFNQADFGVFPSHAEGWNLEPLELMACGTPSIVTNYSGHTEFCNSSNSLLLEPSGMEKAQDGKWFHGQGNWCSYSVDDLVDLLRAAHKMKQEDELAYASLQDEAIKTASKFTWSNVVDKLIGVL